MTIYFKAFAFMEWFDWNSSSNGLFEIFSTKNFLDDSFVCFCILFIALKISKIYSSGLILVNTQQSSFSIAFCVSISWLIFLLLWANSPDSIVIL